MKKYLWFAVAILLLSGIVTVHHENDSQYAKSINIEETKQPRAKPGAPDAKENVEETEHDSSLWAFGYLVFGWPSGIGVIGLFVTMVAIAEQSYFTRVSAEAALLNVQSVINAERAILLFKAEMDESGEMLTLKIVNYGRVPARKIEISKPIYATMRLADLTAMPPDYGNDLEGIQEWLAPNEAWIVAKIAPKWTRMERFYDATKKNLQMTDVDHITYGQVTYFDGISPKRRHSRYCIAMDDDPYEPISVVGNEAYLECT
ncbi:hypothetical protein [Granulicella tundricola]|uniref:Uncharacterized protein n=1 Tax=Granulicella tundricola (strain ATCC BAA-1859 / DSM 23138 / MP5ACTX9) TaxID=1198114 RepID=E8WXM3_GRATM|nr:hypothetical protein [Granulicella tundricola]ADW68639.1 hypothetical protein AciX9_1586 [Granulicella tundricola MP5ACTX9]